MNLRQLSVIGAAAALGTVLSTSAALAQTPPPTPPPAPQREAAPEPKAQQPDMAASIKGELESVDATTKTLVVKTAEGKSETIRYDDATQVTGGESGEAGLVNSKGTQVTVKFRGTGIDRVASEIAIGEKK